MLEIIIGVIVVISIIAFVVVLYNNKYEMANIKIEKAEQDISLYLKNKLELLQRTRPIVKKALRTKEFMEDLDNVSIELNNAGRLGMSSSFFSTKVFFDKINLV